VIPQPAAIAVTRFREFLKKDWLPGQHPWRLHGDRIFSSAISEGHGKLLQADVYTVPFDFELGPATRILPPEMNDDWSGACAFHNEDGFVAVVDNHPTYSSRVRLRLEGFSASESADRRLTVSLKLQEGNKLVVSDNAGRVHVISLGEDAPGAMQSFRF
jgi:hypothetical protein